MNPCKALATAQKCETGGAWQQVAIMGLESIARNLLPGSRTRTNSLSVASPCLLLLTVTRSSYPLLVYQATYCEDDGIQEVVYESINAIQIRWVFIVYQFIKCTSLNLTSCVVKNEQLFISDTNLTKSSNLILLCVKKQVLTHLVFLLYSFIMLT